jgi:long-chain acyl-CoA synthetase
MPDTAGADPLTMTGLFLARAGELATRPLVHSHHGGRWQDISWIELQEHAMRIACGLVGAGIQMGDRVLLLSENRVEWLACDLGIQAAGATTVPVHPAAAPRAAQTIAAESDAVLAIASCEELAARLHLTDALGRIVRLEGEVARWLHTPFDERRHREVARRLSRLGPDDAATIVHGSGAAAEVVVLTHRDLVAAARACVEEFGVGGDDVALAAVPYADAAQRLWGMTVPLTAGATVWLSRGADLLDEDVQAARPTLIHCAPSALDGIRRRVEAEIGERPAPRRAVVRWALAASRERARGQRHRLADGLVLASLRRRIGGGRLRFFTTGEMPPDVTVFFASVGLPVHPGGVRKEGWAPSSRSTPATGEGKPNARVG